MFEISKYMVLLVAEIRKLFNALQQFQGTIGLFYKQRARFRF